MEGEICKLCKIRHLVKTSLDFVIIRKQGDSGEKMRGQKKIKKNCQIINQPLGEYFEKWFS